MMLHYALVTVFVVAEAGNLHHGIERFIAPTVCSTFASLLLLWLLSGRGGAIRTLLEWQPLCWVRQQIFIALAFLAAAASYYLMETPLRKKIRAHFQQ